MAPPAFATYYAAIVLIWYLDRFARKARRRCFKVARSLTGRETIIPIRAA